MDLEKGIPPFMETWKWIDIEGKVFSPSLKVILPKVWHKTAQLKSF
jgi:hypothetical protein